MTSPLRLASWAGTWLSLGDVHERARRNGARQGTPVIMHTSGDVDARVNLFFRTGPMAAARPATWRRYAFALVVWLNFLRVWGRPWDQAGPGDVEAFKDWRLTDARNDGRVAPASFDTDRAALNSFYGWASSRYGIANPVPTAPRRGWRGADDSGAALGDLPGRDGLRPASASRRQVKWMLRPAFEQWVDIGLRGYGFDGLRRAGWRGGGCEDRDIAFTDGLYGTGLRLTEWASVLDVELPPAGGAIPPDPAGRIYSTRFRRTLAYFIVRRPGGLIAAALQYGHVRSKVTLGYAGAADTGWLDDLTVERLEMVLEQADTDWRHLAGGEHVSGPAAGDYRARVQATRPFAGRAVTSIRAAERLLAAADPSIHHGEAMTCVWRAETAACRNTRLQQGLPVSDAPEPSECQSSCRNLAWTGRDITAQRERAARLAAAAGDPLAPAPLRDRAAARAAQAQAVIDRHDRSRSTDTAAEHETTA
jgi:hypothetical protein